MCEMSRKVLCRHQCHQNILEQHLSSTINVCQGAVGQGDYLWPIAEFIPHNTGRNVLMFLSVFAHGHPFSSQVGRLNFHFVQSSIFYRPEMYLIRKAEHLNIGYNNEDITHVERSH